MKRVQFGLLAASIMLTACGGGDGRGFGNQDPVSTSFPITSGNGVETTRLSYEAALASGGFAEIGVAPITAAPDGGMQAAALPPGFEDYIRDVISLVPYGPIVEDCVGGGTITETGDRASDLTITPGDTTSIVYDNCNDGAGTVTHGSIDLTFRDFSIDTETLGFMVAVDAVITGFTVTTATDEAVVEGDTSITIDTTTLNAVTTTVSGTRISERTNTSSQVLSLYGSESMLDNAGLDAIGTMNSYGTLTHQDLPGDVDYSTPVDFVSIVPSYPFQGELLVQGEDSTARLIVLDDTMVRVDIDENNDGVVDYSEEFTWDAFLGNGT